MRVVFPLSIATEEAGEQLGMVNQMRKILSTVMGVASALGLSVAASAQTASQNINVAVNVDDAVSVIFIDQSTAAPTYAFDTTGVDILEGGVSQDFTFCVTGSTTGGYRVANPNYVSNAQGVPLTGSIAGAGQVKAELRVAGVNTSSSGPSSRLTNAASNTTYSYGSNCAANDSGNRAGRLDIDEQSGVTAITSDIFTGTLVFQVIPQ